MKCDIWQGEGYGYVLHFLTTSSEAETARYAEPIQGQRGRAGSGKLMSLILSIVSSEHG